jgi:hypothetical protein
MVEGDLPVAGWERLGLRRIDDEGQRERERERERAASREPLQGGTERVKEAWRNTNGAK